MSWRQIWNEISLIEGWLNYPVAKLLHEKAKRVPNELPIVEIGSWKGRSTVLLSKSSSSSKVYAIDPHIGSSEHHGLSEKPIDTFEEFKRNLKSANVLENVKIVRKASRDALDDVPDKIGMLWIDGSHEYKDVYDDFKLWFPRLIEGGHVLFHDSKWPGVKQVLWEELYTSCEVSFIGRTEDTTYAKKRDQANSVERIYNTLILEIYKKRHKLKRLKRKLKKQIKKWK